MSKPLELHAWSPTREPAALAFLNERYATSMFLLGNHEYLGTALTEHANSGDYRVLARGDEVVGVFSLTRRGNLLITAEPHADVLPLVLVDCLKSRDQNRIPLQGILGDWEIVYQLQAYFRAQGAIANYSFESKEILYRLDTIPISPPVPEVRFLTEEDFPQWRAIRRDYNAEVGIKHDLSEEALHANFLRYASANEYWALCEGEQMVATTALNARTAEIGQVGGVYTLPSRRVRGLSQKVMRQMLTDCAQVHGLKRMILFTGEENLPAQRVYEKLGFQRIGHFGIFLA